MRLWLLSWLLFVGCGAQPVAAAPKGRVVSVKLYRVMHPAALSDCQIEEAISWARTRIEEAGYGLQVEGVVDVPAWELSHAGVSVSATDPEHQLLRLYAAREWLEKRKELKKWRMHYFLYPPIEYENGQRGFGGYSFGFCTIAGGGVAFGQAGAWSTHQPPRPRIDASGMIFAHEAVLGHGCGMRHADVEAGFVPNIMDSAAGRFVDSHDLRYSSSSVAEAVACLGAVRVRFMEKCTKKRKKRACRKRFQKRLPVLRSGGTNEFPIFF